MSNNSELINYNTTNASSWLSTHGFVLNNREWAALAWLIFFLTIVIALALRKPEIRTSIGNVLRSALSTKLAPVWVAYAVWVISLVLIADWVGIWQATLTKDTFVWSLTAGVVLLVGFAEASELGYFRRALSDVLGLVAFVEYFLNLATFSFLIELALQPAVFLVTIAPTIVDNSNQKKTWRRIRDGFSAILLLFLLGHTGLTLYATWEASDWRLFALQVMWHSLLGIWVLMLVFILAVIANYERAFLQLKWSRDETQGLWKAKLGLLLALGIRLKWIHEAGKGGTNHVARARSVGEAFRAAKNFKKELIVAERREAAYQEDLVRYAGSTEQDEEGRPLDRREFRETVQALEWLHTCQMGWYRREPTGYRPDLMELLGDGFTRFGLEKPFGITLKVSADRERWYAWRRTEGGHCFAIGASEEPPSTWRYDGPEPPKDYPGIGQEWGDSPFSDEQCPNWYR